MNRRRFLSLVTGGLAALGIGRAANLDAAPSEPFDIEQRSVAHLPTHLRRHRTLGPEPAPDELVVHVTRQDYVAWTYADTANSIPSIWDDETMLSVDSVLRIRPFRGGTSE